MNNHAFDAWLCFYVIRPIYTPWQADDIIHVEVAFVPERGKI